MSTVTVFYEVHSYEQGNIFLEERLLADLQSAGKLPIVHDREQGRIITEEWQPDEGDYE